MRLSWGVAGTACPPGTTQPGHGAAGTDCLSPINPVCQALRSPCSLLPMSQLRTGEGGRGLPRPRALVRGEGGLQVLRSRGTSLYLHSLSGPGCSGSSCSCRSGAQRAGMAILPLLPQCWVGLGTPCCLPPRGQGLGSPCDAAGVCPEPGLAPRTLAGACCSWGVLAADIPAREVLSGRGQGRRCWPWRAGVSHVCSRNKAPGPCPVTCGGSGLQQARRGSLRHRAPSRGRLLAPGRQAGKGGCLARERRPWSPVRRSGCWGAPPARWSHEGMPQARV